MGILKLPGLATGIDTASLVKQLIDAESGRLKMMESSLAKAQEKQNAYSELAGKLQILRQASEAMADSEQLRSFKAVSSDSDVISVEAGTSAFEGSHTVQVKQLATADKWIHEGFQYSSSYVGQGYFIFSYNNRELVVHTTEQTTLEDLVGLINNDADNPGVNASILKYDDGSGKLYHLVLSGKDSGSDYQITVNNSNTEVITAQSHLTDRTGADAAISTKLIDLSSFSGTIESGSTADRIHITGTKHDGSAVDVYFDVTRYTTIEDLVGRINDAFGSTATAAYSEGRLRLTDDTCGTSSMTLDIDFVAGEGSSASLSLPTFAQTTQGGGITADIAALAAAKFTETQPAQDSQIRVDGYPPATWISRSTNTIDDVIAGVTLRLHDTTANDQGGYDSIDVNLSRDTETLKKKVNSLIEAYNTAVMYIQEKTAYNEKTKQAAILSNDFNISTIWTQIRSAFSTAASGFGGDDSFKTAADIGLKLGADKMLSLDAKTFDEAIVDDYLGVLELIGASGKGLSNSADIKFYASGSSTTAGQYEVRVYGNGTSITSAQIRPSGQTEWRDATFDGNVVAGNSTLDENGKPLYPENNLQLTVDVSRTSPSMPLTATISVRQGFAGSLDDSLDNMLNTISGRVPIAKKGVGNNIKSINSRIEKEKNRLAREETRLTERFARLERTLALIQQQMSSLTSMLNR